MIMREPTSWTEFQFQTHKRVESTVWRLNDASCLAPVVVLYCVLLGGNQCVIVITSMIDGKFTFISFLLPNPLFLFPYSCSRYGLPCQDNYTTVSEFRFPKDANVRGLLIWEGGKKGKVR